MNFQPKKSRVSFRNWDGFSVSLKITGIPTSAGALVARCWVEATSNVSCFRGLEKLVFLSEELCNLIWTQQSIFWSHWCRRTTVGSKTTRPYTTLPLQPFHKSSMYKPLISNGVILMVISQIESGSNNPPVFCQESVGGAADGILPLHVQRHARCPWARGVWWNPDSTSESTVSPIQKKNPTFYWS